MTFGLQAHRMAAAIGMPGSRSGPSNFFPIVALTSNIFAQCFQQGDGCPWQGVEWNQYGLSIELNGRASCE
jgi:hypothetical protein